MGKYYMEESVIMLFRDFSQSSKKLSVLGLGTVKFGRNNAVKYPGGEGFQLPNDKEINELLDLCVELGINFLDTAPAYGSSEKRLGDLLGDRREKFFIVTKTGEEFFDGKSEYIFTKEHTQMSVERSLNDLKTDYLDCVMVHSSRDDLEVIINSPVLEVLDSYKQKGDILSYGVSTYTIEGGKKAADLSDAVMVYYNPEYRDELPVIEYARQQNKAVFIKKGLQSGHVNKLGMSVEETINHIVNVEGVTSMIFGSLNKNNIKMNVEALKDGL
jgi:aryl-alcohol dehydrogenase-like predicted oxidoreductase